MSVVEYRDKFLTLSRYAPDETDTNEKRKERFLNGLHDEMQTVLVNIPFVDLEALVDSAIQMEGKLHQANENRKRRMMNQHGPHHTQKYRNNSSGGFTPRHNKPPAQNYRPNYSNNNGGPPKPGGNHNNHSKNNNSNPNHTNNHPNGNNNNPNNAPKTGSNTVPINPKDKSTINCYECGVVGHYSNECPKKLARIAANTAAPAQNNAASQAKRNTTHAGTRRGHHDQARQSVQGRDHGHARAWSLPVATDLPLTPPFSHALTRTSAPSQTWSSDPRSSVAVVTVDVRRHYPPEHDDRPSYSVHPLPRHDARHARPDHRNRPRTPPCPFAARSAIATMTCPCRPALLIDPINRVPPRLFQARHPLLRSSVKLLEPSPFPISYHAAPISSSEAAGDTHVRSRRDPPSTRRRRLGRLPASLTPLDAGKPPIATPWPPVGFGLRRALLVDGDEPEPSDPL
ncbi:hypothetical protein QYE76_041117 [Lolium multiflorum]|uniref:CCHC-type domain-containing protein n=1 Tax=Lolium multiflorum TaxID=4521 RepID=A0AAD8WTU7_LOLMU|nr:hypothetical protein QYE76_041117 [Lolium multiflorum]